MVRMSAELMIDDGGIVRGERRGNPAVSLIVIRPGIGPCASRAISKGAEI